MTSARMVTPDWEWDHRVRDASMHRTLASSWHVIAAGPHVHGSLHGV